MIRLWRIALACAACLGYVGCLVSGDVEGPPLEPGDYQFSSEDTAEAELVALDLSRELYPPEDLTVRTLHDLMALRETFRDSFPVVGMRFVPLWEPGRIVIEFDDATRNEVLNDRYHAWDELNRQFRMMVEGLPGPSPEYTWYGLSTTMRVHSGRLADLYRGLPGVRRALAEGFPVGQRPTSLTLGMVESDILYHFRVGWGDCYVGCMHNEHWYFASDGQGVRYLGRTEKG